MSFPVVSCVVSDMDIRQSPFDIMNGHGGDCVNPFREIPCCVADHLVVLNGLQFDLISSQPFVHVWQVEGLVGMLRDHIPRHRQ